MIRKKSIVSLILAAVMLVLMVMAAGCSDSASAGIPFSETVTGEDVRIWYECQNKVDDDEDPYDLGIFADDSEDQDSQEPVEYGRETVVVWIKVYENGNLTTYTTLKNVYLGHFAKMTDEDIIKELKSDKDTYLAGRTEAFEIYLYSDASGHEIVFEGVPTTVQMSAKDDPMYFMTLFSTDTVPTFQVYDSYYGGFELYNYDEKAFGEACLITRCDDGTVFCLDPIDLEAAILDYDTPEDMLHEKNDALRKQLHPEGEEGDTDADADGTGDGTAGN